MKLSEIYVRDKEINGEIHQFILLFHHKLVDQNYFTTNSDFLFANSQNKYSLFGYFDDSFSFNGYFHFLYEWPEKNCLLFFKQLENPLKTSHNMVVSFDINYTNCTEPKQQFSGTTLFKENSSTFLDGTNDVNAPDHYFYAIGQRSQWSGSDQLAGYSTQKGEVIKEVNFWVKLNNLSPLKRFVNCLTCKQSLSIRLSFAFFFSNFFFS